MKKWSTDWTPIDVVSHIQHKEIAEQATPLALHTVGNVVNTKPRQADPFTDFIKPPAEPEIIIQGHTDEALAAAKQQAFEDGKNTATTALNAQLTQAQQELQTGLGAAFAELDSHLPPLANAWQDYNREISEKTSELAYTIAKKVATKALDDNALNNIEQLVEQCLGHILREPKVEINLHSNHQQAFEQHLSSHPTLASVKDHIIVTANETIAQTDCTIHWHQGGASLDINQRWQHVEALLGLEPTQTALKATEEAPAESTQPEQQEKPAADDKVDVQGDSDTL